jgi:hypothetical protein
MKRVLVTGVILGVLAGCNTLDSADRVVREVTYSGVHNFIEGTLSDGTEFTGVGWFANGKTSGNFCLQAKDMVCSGTYKAGLARRLSGIMVCSNGLTGEYVTERIVRGNTASPISATGSMSDGRTATATFSGIRASGGGTTTCFVPPA